MVENKEIYLVSDYNPKYLNKPIKSAISKIMSEIKEDKNLIKYFEVDMIDEVTGLRQNSAKAIFKLKVTTECEEKKFVGIMNGLFRKKISDQSIYNVSISSSSGRVYFT